MEIIVALLLIPIFLWILSIYMLRRWSKSKLFFIVNGIVLATYLIILTYGKSMWGHDEYGLGLIFWLLFCVWTHILIVFAFSFFQRQRIDR